MTKLIYLSQTLRYLLSFAKALNTARLARFGTPSLYFQVFGFYFTRGGAETKNEPSWPSLPENTGLFSPGL